VLCYGNHKENVSICSNVRVYSSSRLLKTAGVNIEAMCQTLAFSKHRAHIHFTAELLHRLIKPCTHLIDVSHHVLISQLIILVSSYPEITIGQLLQAMRYTGNTPVKA